MPLIVVAGLGAIAFGGMAGAATGNALKNAAYVASILGVLLTLYQLKLIKF